ncbi:mucoidy inhibitor MuiA family protein [Croceimicrobium hydrocarbonivorans]|uniref:DUF4139 domain-containing protein n=1 Tax=Croceimicrobium hydrocarbonivorans TaxID=2761580 RepID=A0A7H0VE13_9FLAO|nr:mucoidy inhibitor MuiA family protein [Croceimicrobium hydrocarbonivorans]QNR23961.1 DUF4139 domain-containing protein [Croceimicrobium hydrocarbonivorans]
MRKWIVLLACLSLNSIALRAADTLRLKSKIDRVTVFFSGAEVFSQAQLQVNKGEHFIIIENLPPNADPQSIKVSGLDGVLIHSVNHRVVEHLPWKDPEIRRLKEEEKALIHQIGALSEKQEVYHIEKRIIIENSKLSNGESSLTAAQIREAADFYRQRLMELSLKQVELQNQITSLHNQWDSLKLKYNKRFVAIKSSQLEITIKLECLRPLRDSLNFSYYTAFAGWTPHYDVRVNSLDQPISLIYKANIYQSSGVDWSHVKLKLSTENPQLSRIAPKIATWILPNKEQTSRYQKPQQASRLLGKVLSPEGAPVPYAPIEIYQGSFDNLIYQTLSDAKGEYSLKPLTTGNYFVKVNHFAYQEFRQSLRISGPEVKFDIKLEKTQILVDGGNHSTKSTKVVTAEDIQNMAVRDITTVGGSYQRIVQVPIMATGTSNDISNLQYEIRKQQSIPSDGKDYSFDMQEAKVPTHYVYQIVPKLDPRAYLIAEISDWEQLQLLPGPARMYLYGSYVGITEVDPSTIKDTLRLSLGQDKGLNVERKVDELVEAEGFFGDDIGKQMAWDIEIRNLKNEMVSLLVYDQVPLSGRDYIRVKALDLGGAKLNSKTGELVWKIDLDAKETRTLKFSYQVRYPRTVTID